MIVTVLSNQSLLDLAIRLYGTADSVFLLAQENGLNVTDTLIPGQQLNYSPDKVLNRQIAQYYENNGVHPATEKIDTQSDKIFDPNFDITFE